MAVRVSSDARKGQIVCVNDAQVWFDEDGVCVGIVGYADGAKPEEPDPLRDEDVAAFAAGALYTVEGDGVDAVDAQMAVVADDVAEDLGAVPVAVNLSDMTWPDVQKLAAEHGIKAVGRKRVAVEADLRAKLELPQEG